MQATYNPLITHLLSRLKVANLGKPAPHPGLPNAPGAQFAARHRGLAASHRGFLTRTEGTVTKGAVIFAQICANLANTMDLHPLVLPANLVNFAHIRQTSCKFGKVCFLPYFLDLHPRLSHPRLFGPKHGADRGGGVDNGSESLDVFRIRSRRDSLRH